MGLGHKAAGCNALGVVPGLLLVYWWAEPDPSMAGCKVGCFRASVSLLVGEAMAHRCPGAGVSLLVGGGGS